MDKNNCILDINLLTQNLKYSSIKPALFHSLDSTNQTAKQYGANGAEEGALIIAGEQSQGRGRLGRSFYSPKSSGVYFTLLLRPTIPAEEGVLITAAAAVALCEAVMALSKSKVQIKWVNDIFVNGKKVCGILSESVLNSKGGMEYTVLGIGANLFEPEAGFPKDIKNIAGAIFNKPVLGVKEKFIAETINRFMEYYNNLNTLNFVDKYREYSLIIGKEITYFLNKTHKKATVLDIDDRCRLRVKNEDGSEELLSSGEVTIGSGTVI